MKKSLLTTMTVDIFLFFTKMKEKGFTLLKARLQDLLTSLKTKLVFKKPTGKPKCVVNKYGHKEWWLNGKLHREDGPAFEGCSGGDKEWWLNGKYHREDGPAREWENGTKEWWLHGEMVHPETLVDLHLIRGTFCYYNEETRTLHFDENE